MMKLKNRLELQKLEQDGHRNALVAFGRELYDQGFITGVVSVVVGATSCLASMGIVDAIFDATRKKHIKREMVKSELEDNKDSGKHQMK